MKIITFVFCFILAINCSAQKKIIVVSPDGNIVFSFGLINKQAVYNVLYKGNSIVSKSKLGLEFSDGNFGNNLSYKKPIYSDSVEDYDLIVGKAKHIHDPYNQIIIPLQQTDGNKRKINVVVRAFNSGVAFRYDLPQQEGWNDFTLNDEHTDFNFANNPTVHALGIS